MNINLSDETLDHLRYHLGVLAATYQSSLANTQARKASPRTANTITKLQARITEVRDLQAIFEGEQPVAPAYDVTVTQDGSVFHFALHQDAAVEFVRDNFSTEPWQWLGKSALGIDHRFAPQVVAQLRDNGFSVVVR